MGLVAQQQTADIGLFAGGALPFTDYSQINMLQSVKFDYGGFYRYNFNSRYGIRINAIYGNVGAEGYLDNTQIPASSFKKSVFNVSALIEINYLDFLLGVEYMRFSPYIYYGLGLSFYTGTDENLVVTGNIPIGIGAKYALSKRWGIGAEISTLKLFNDELDNLSNPYGAVNLTNVNDIYHNNDWINYIGVTLIYKVYWGKSYCPAYNSLYE